MSEIRLLPSVTDLALSDRGQVAITGSHGGLFPASVASRRGLRAVVFNDAGGGAGVEGLFTLDDVGMAAAAVDCMSCHIGSAEDAARHGIISYVNRTAGTLGIASGQDMAEASSLLHHAPAPAATLPSAPEARSMTQVAGRDIHLLDSASLVTSDDTGHVLVTGSHGGLVGNDPRRALKADAMLAVFNDAGMGKDRIGIARLKPLGARGVAAVTVAHDTARIGDARSALEEGEISALNEQAAEMGAARGMALHTFLSVMVPIT
ncbi:MAG: hypothetical protein AAF367_11665 [Pseudomonadota bacterium]